MRASLHIPQVGKELIVLIHDFSPSLLTELFLLLPTCSSPEDKLCDQASQRSPGRVSAPGQEPPPLPHPHSRLPELPHFQAHPSPCWISPTTCLGRDPTRQCPGQSTDSEIGPRRGGSLIPAPTGYESLASYESSFLTEFPH